MFRRHLTPTTGTLHSSRQASQSCSGRDCSFTSPTTLLSSDSPPSNHSPSPPSSTPIDSNLSSSSTRHLHSVAFLESLSPSPSSMHLAASSLMSSGDVAAIIRARNNPSQRQTKPRKRESSTCSTSYSTKSGSKRGWRQILKQTTR
ncbi:hypothetical protein BLNAU_5454 [Blattamonas nauphoetae]|uniref:Uncharacterized protein n=1 Tax=Blattamonas nauphoetae TaxID=2049346 RepID=A0ABQ9Y7H6_9EUKA|nr:hypothetical protein BLNAU_5454 [Blattamonas nauphoetae]